jgi:hypothetical protein
VDNYYGDIPRGIFLIRGENVVLTGEIDEDKPNPLTKVLYLTRHLTLGKQLDFLGRSGGDIAFTGREGGAEAALLPGQAAIYAWKWQSRASEEDCCRCTHGRLLNFLLI